MPGDPSCPTGRELLRLMLGQIGREDAILLKQHIDPCDQCREQIRTLGVEGTQFQAALETEETATKLPGIVPAAPPPVSVKAAGVDPQIQVLLKPAQAADEIGRLGNYRILKVLGSGAAGVVFHAEDVRLKRPVALKLLKPVEKGQEEAKQRFLREGQLAASLEHEHVLTIYQVGEDDGGALPGDAAAAR